MGDNVHLTRSGLMSLLRRLHLKPRRGEPSKLWVMSETAPFQVPITFYLFLLGVTNLLSNLGVTPNSVQSTYPTWFVIVWSSATALGCGLSLVGRYAEAFRMEASGLAFLLAACAIFVGAVLWVNGLTAAWAALGYIAISTGCIIRMRVISRHHKAQKLAGEIIQNNGDSPL